MSIHKITRSSDNFTVWLDSITSVQITKAEAEAVLVESDRSDPVQVAAKMTALLQDRLDFRQPLTDLPDGVDTGDEPDNIDPDRTIDPARPDLFWQVIDGVTYLVGRSILATVIWDGSRYVLETRST